LIVLLLFSFMSIFSFFETAKAGTQTFGYTSQGGSSESIGNVIRGSIFTCSANGTAESISAWLISSFSTNAKAAIYYSNLTLLAETDQEAISPDGVATLYTFDFSSPPTVTAGTQYILTVWGNNVGAHPYLYYSSGDTDQGYYQSLDYSAESGNFPNPLVPSNNNYKYSIYATFTETGEYNFNFYGLFDENTGYLKDVSERAVNVTAYWNDGTASQTFEVNGTDYRYFDTHPQHFVFDLTGADREYWLSADEGDADTVDIYIFTDTLTAYTLSFRDWTGALSTYSWVSVMRYINGTSVVMDKRKVDEQNKVVMAMQEGKTYAIQVEAVAGTTYTWGDLTMTSDTTVDLVVKGLTFPQDVILTYRYVRAYGYRENYNTTYDSVVHLYEDTILNTDSVNISIYDGDDTLIHSYECSDTDSFTYTWSGAVNTTSYHSVVTISHGDYGTLVFRQSFLRGFEESPFDLSFLGSLPGGISVSSLLPMGILLVVTLSFSALTAGIGGIVVVVLAGVLNIIGWVDIDANTLVFAAILAVIYAVLKNYKRVTER